MAICKVKDIPDNRCSNMSLAKKHYREKEKGKEKRIKESTGKDVCSIMPIRIDFCINLPFVADSQTTRVSLPEAIQ